MVKPVGKNEITRAYQNSEEIINGNILLRPNNKVLSKHK